MTEEWDVVKGASLFVACAEYFFGERRWCRKITVGVSLTSEPFVCGLRCCSLCYHCFVFAVLLFPLGFNVYTAVGAAFERSVCPGSLWNKDIVNK